MQRRIVLLILTLCLSGTLTHAAWWWPFGTKASQLPPQQQTELSEEAYRKALAYDDRGRDSAAARKYKRVFKKYPLSDYAAQSLFNYGLICYEKQDWKDSFNAFQTALLRYPEFPRFNEIINYQFNIALACAEGRGTRFLWVIPYKAYNRAVQYFELVVFNAPYSDLAPLALMNVALIHQHRDDVPEAIDALDRMINNYPNSLLTDDAYLKLADTFADLVEGPLYDQGATREAISYYEDFLILFPENERVAQGEEGLRKMENSYAKSKLVIGQFYYRYRNWYTAAEIFFNEAITIAPESESAQRAREYLVRIEEFRAKAKADPNYSPPRTSLTDHLFFWRKRTSNLDPEPIADPGVDPDSSEASFSESGIE